MVGVRRYRPRRHRAPGLGRRRRSSRHGLTSSLSCSTTRRAATTRPASVAGPPGHAVPIGGLSAGDMLGTGVRSRVRMGGHAAISDGSLAASEAGGISGSGARRALALFGAPGPERPDPDRWNEQAVYPGFGVILQGCTRRPSSAQPSSVVCTGGGSGMGAAPPIKAHLTGHGRRAGQPAPTRTASIRARAC